MSPLELHRAIARATGESHDVITSRGFSLVNDMEPLVDDDFDDLIADWEMIEAEEIAAHRISTSKPHFSKNQRVRTTRGKTLRNTMTVRTRPTARSHR